MNTKRSVRLILVLMPIVVLLGLQSAAAENGPATAQVSQSLSVSSLVDERSLEPDDSPQTPVVVRLTYADEALGPVQAQANLDGLAAWLDIWEVDPEARTLLALVQPDEYDFLLRAGYSLEIDPELTQQVLVPPGYPCYRTVEQLYNTLAQTVTLNYPEITEWVFYGYSWEKLMPAGPEGYDLYALEITNEAIPGPKPVAVIDAGIHSREMTPPEVAMALIDYLTVNYGHDPDVTWLVDYHKTVIPIMMNPDGRKMAETGDYWRKNTDSDDGCSNPDYWGVDLNRNFNVQWGCCGGSSGYPCDSTYRGPSPDSEPETYYYQSYVESQVGDQWHYTSTHPAPLTTTGILINMHSYGEWVLYPWGWTSGNAPNNTGLKAIAEKFASMNGYTARRSLYAVDGVLRDWAYGDLGIPAFTLEIGTTFFQSCSNLPGIIAENLPPLSYVIRIARAPYMLVHGPDVSDLSLTPGATVSAPTVQLDGTINDAQNGGQPIAAAVYYVDDLPWITSTLPLSYPMTAVDGAFDEVIEPVRAQVDLETLSTGRHTLFVQGQDAAGNWGPVWSTWVTVTRGWVTGTVADAWSGAPISGADLTLAAPAWTYTTQSDGSGSFAQEVFVGVYTVTAGATDYYSLTLPGITVQDGLTTGLQLDLVSMAGDLALNKTVSPPIAGPGQPVTYTLVYHNFSPQPPLITGTQVTDLVPVPLVDLDFSYAGPAITPTGGLSYTWMVADLASGQGGVITVTGRVSPGATGLFSLTNQASITSAVADMNPTNNVSTVTHTVDAQPPLAPILSSPSHGALLSDTELILAWQPSPSPDVAGYWLDWAGSPLDVGGVTQYPVTLAADGAYTWTLAAYDRVRNRSPYTDVWSFTVDATPPAAEQTVPADGASGVALAAPLVISFSEEIDPDTLTYTLAPDPGGWSAAWSGDGTNVTLHHDPLAYGTAYTASLHGARDLAGNPLLDAPVAWTFTSAACQEVTAVSLTQVTRGSLYPGEVVTVQVDLGPDQTTGPYRYRLTLDGMPGVEMTATVEPWTFAHTFDLTGGHSLEVAVWNCGLSETQAVTDALALVVEPFPTCTQVGGVSLTPAATGTLYLGEALVFSAQVTPTEATTPYTYVVDYGDGTLSLPASSDQNPWTFSHTYQTAGIYLAQIDVWNCSLTETQAVTDAYTLTVSPACVGLDSISILGEIGGPPGVYTFSASYQPGSATLPFQYLWDNGDETALTVRSLEVGTHTLSLTATNCADGVVSDTHQIVIEQLVWRVYLPVLLKSD